MKFLLFRKFIWVILFSLVHLWFMIFNWQLFITMLNINLGFGVVRLPPFVVLFLTGFVILLIQSWTGYVNKLHRIIHDLEEKLSGQNEVRQSSRTKGIGVDHRVSGSEMGKRKDGVAGEDRVPAENRTQKKPAEKGDRKEENRSGTDPKKPIL
jgi:hypothetical protein